MTLPLLLHAIGRRTGSGACNISATTKIQMRSRSKERGKVPTQDARCIPVSSMRQGAALACLLRVYSEVLSPLLAHRNGE